MGNRSSRSSIRREEWMVANYVSSHPRTVTCIEQSFDDITVTVTDDESITGRVEDPYVLINHNKPKVPKTCSDAQLPMLECPVTLLEMVPAFTAPCAMKQLQKAEFNFLTHWEDLGRHFEVKLEERSKFLQETRIEGDFKRALEQCLDIWIHNSSNASWTELISAVDAYERCTAERLRKNLGLYDADTLRKLKMPCDEGILGRLNIKLKISDYEKIVQYFLSANEKAMIDNEPDDQKILKLFQHWKDCRGHIATYEALICIFRSAISEPHAIDDLIVLHIGSYSLTTTGTLLEEDTFKTVNALSSTERRVLKSEFELIHRSFADVLSSGFSSISKNAPFSKAKIYVLSRCGNQEKYMKAQNLEELVLALSTSVDWFNFKIFKELLLQFGEEVNKQKLEEYSINLQKFLNRSVVQLPKTIGEANSISSSCTKVVLKIPDSNSEPPVVYGTDVPYIQEKLGEYISIPGENLKLYEYRQGCIELVFSINTDVSCEPAAGLQNMEWNEEYQEYRIKADSELFMPDTFFQRNTQSK